MGRLWQGRRSRRGFIRKSGAAPGGSPLLVYLVVPLMRFELIIPSPGSMAVNTLPYSAGKHFRCTVNSGHKFAGILRHDPYTLRLVNFTAGFSF